MSGSDWDDLTTLLAATRSVLMAPRHWTRLAERLLSEQLIADGPAWRLRSEATHRLLWHPRGRPHVVAACAATIRDRRCPIVVEPFAILDLAVEPDVTALLFAQLTEPVAERAVRGALLAAVSKVRQRLFTSDELRRIADIAIHLLSDPKLHTLVRPLAAELVGRLPPALHDHSVRRLHRAFAADPGLAGVVTARRTADPDQSNRTVERVVGHVVSTVPGYTDPTSDEMLARLVDEILFSTNLDIRLHAAQVAGATPYRVPLARALGAELRTPAVMRDPARAGAILEALPFLGGAADRRVVENMVLASGLDPATCAGAAWAISHLPGASPPAFWSAALDHHRLAWSRTHARAAREVLRGLTYALGIAGDTRGLAAIEADLAMPPDSRASARWWSNVPTVIRNSART
ncbi:hypothetical protein [Asanoa sp. NPDC050611]|uniref:hypothetical protein n=1 Tax=Asanoa sp. NPDC050611 TaxID=3157098 RepID=UPI00340C7341